MTKLDLDFVRSQFPAFSEPGLSNQSFFENAGGSYACAPVIDRLTRFYRQRKVQPYGPYPAAQAGGAEMDEARSRLAALMGVKTHEVSFGPSTSANAFVLANAVRKWLQPGEVIVVTNQDHEANSGVWRRLADEGIVVREWCVDPETGHLDPADLEDLLDGARLLCFPHCSNVVAEINDVTAISARAHAAGAFVIVDGVSYAPHGLPDVGALGCDVYMFSAYKVYGPHQGIMVVREDFGMTLPNQGHYFNGDSLYKRFTPAGPDHAQIAASAGMVDYFDALATHHGLAGGAAAHDLMRNHEIALMQPLLDYLGGLNSVRLLGPNTAVDRAPTFALELAGSGEEASEKLGKLGINCWGGDFYAVRPLQAMGVDLDKGVLRVSFVHYTSAEDIQKLIEGLDQVL
ncbi:MAG: aminotransferase class V-fold PLP-dependent enzyme [Rhodobacteraceae bacterium]|nr:aminotransferase class V-fold PLP-dependent enzyme [Paracoccaceae bacterium]